MRFLKVSSSLNNYWVKEIIDLSPFKHNNPDIVIDSSKRYQNIMGFGGAFTDATVENYNLLDNIQKKAFVNGYFSKEGLNYSLARYPMQSTDFSSYSYNYLAKDSHDLSTLSLEVDKDKINLIKECEKVRGDKLEIMLSTWSPFAWMKTNNSLYQGGHLKKEYYDDWSNYIARVIKKLKEENINITMVTSQNEVEAKQTWESCLYFPQEEGEFINYLYKNLIELDINDIDIYLLDHNRDLLPSRIIDTMKYVTSPITGVAYHWYDHSCFNNLTKLHELYPSFHILMSECCVELLIDKNPIGDISHAERYAYEMIMDLNNYSEGYIDWNLMLNEIGGPNHVGNFCESPIMFNRTTKELMFLPSYYYIGHFSKYLSKEHIRIETSCLKEGISAVSFIDSKDKITTIILNKENEDQLINIKINKEEYALNVPAHTIINLISE